MTDIEIPEGFTRWNVACPIVGRHSELLFENGDSIKTKRPQEYDWHGSAYPENNIIAYRVLP